MHTIKNMGAQGDLLVMRVEALPKGVKEEPCSRVVVVAHSETGHHHKLELREGFEAKLFRGADPFTCYLQIAGGDGECADVVHHRSFDTHGTLTLGPGLWMMRNQREYEPEGWRRVCD